MNAVARSGYHGGVHVTPPRSARPALPWARLVLYAVAVWTILTATPARADVTTYDAVAPVVRINIRQGPVTIRTWDRESVQVDADPSIVVEHKSFRGGGGFGSLPMAAAGNPTSDSFLPAESFVPGPIPPGTRDSILIRSDAASVPGPVVVTVPADSPLIFAIARNGALEMRGYRYGTFVGYTTSGRLSVQGAGGTAFLQSNRGPIVVSDSNFERVRARSLAGNITFERCVVHQIETTAVGGSIVYDGGSFQPGLARFESQRGDVAIGSEAAVELSAHSATGRVYSSFLAPANIHGDSAETHATVSGGGPLVTAASETGNVYLYDGSLRNRAMPAEWQGPTTTLERPGMRRENAQPTRPFSFAPSEARGKFRFVPRPFRRP